MRIIVGSLAVILFAVFFIAGCEDETALVSCGDGKCDPIEYGVCVEDCLICGDGYCDEREADTCPSDCSVCGDDICTADEMDYGCVSDCYPCLNVLYMVITTCIPENCGASEDLIACARCGDGVCQSGENRTGCPDCDDVGFCGDEICTFWEYGVCEDCADIVCGDGMCGPIEEATEACPEDCFICGDGVCHPPEEDFCNIDCRSTIY